MVDNDLRVSHRSLAPTQVAASSCTTLFAIHSLFVTHQSSGKTVGVHATNAEPYRVRSSSSTSVQPQQCTGPRRPYAITLWAFILSNQFLQAAHPLLPSSFCTPGLWSLEHFVVYRYKSGISQSPSRDSCSSSPSCSSLWSNWDA